MQCKISLIPLLMPLLLVCCMRPKDLDERSAAPDVSHATSGTEDHDSSSVVSTIVAKAKAALDLETTCTAASDGTISGCQVGNYTFTPASPNHNGQTIMVIDSGIYFSALTRYASRVLGVYEWQRDGSLQALSPEFSVSRGAYEVTANILGKAPVPIMQTATNVLTEEFYAKLSAGIPDEIKRFGHGTPIFNMLAEFNPEAQFVVVNQILEIEQSDQDFCSLATDAGYAAMSATLDRSIADLSTLVAGMDVRLINLSAGYNYDIAKNRWAMACPSADGTKILAGDKAMWQRLTSALTGFAGVTLVEAGPYPSTDLAVDATSAAVDCQSMPNRVRVGYFTRADSGLGIDGTDDLRLLDDHEDQKNARTCVDLFVNSDFTPAGDDAIVAGANALYTSKYGIETKRNWFTEFGMSTSLAAPLALSYLNYLQQQAKAATGHELSPTELRAKATSSATRPFQDPLATKSLPAFAGDRP